MNSWADNVPRKRVVWFFFNFLKFFGEKNLDIWCLLQNVSGGISKIPTCFLWKSQKHLKPSKTSVTFSRWICLLILKKKIVFWKSWFFNIFGSIFDFFWIFRAIFKNLLKKSKIDAKILKNQLFQETFFFSESAEKFIWWM